MVFFLFHFMFCLFPRDFIPKGKSLSWGYKKGKSRKKNNHFKNEELSLNLIGSHPPHPKFLYELSFAIHCHQSNTTQSMEKVCRYFSQDKQVNERQWDFINIIYKTNPHSTEALWIVSLTEAWTLHHQDGHCAFLEQHSIITVHCTF